MTEAAELRLMAAVMSMDTRSVHVRSRGERWCGLNVSGPGMHKGSARIWGFSVLRSKISGFRLQVLKHSSKNCSVPLRELLFTQAQRLLGSR